jgi:hypothetical protein
MEYGFTPSAAETRRANEPKPLKRKKAPQTNTFETPFCFGEWCGPAPLTVPFPLHIQCQIFQPPGFLNAGPIFQGKTGFQFFSRRLHGPFGYGLSLLQKSAIAAFCRGVLAPRGNELR